MLRRLRNLLFGISWEESNSLSSDSQFCISRTRAVMITVNGFPKAQVLWVVFVL